MTPRRAEAGRLALAPEPTRIADLAVTPDRPRSTAAPAGSGRRGGVLLLNWRDQSHPEGGGSELYVETVATGLAALGERVTVACAAHAGAAPEEWRDGVRYVRGGGRFTVYPRTAVSALAGRLGDHDVIIDVQNGIPFFAPLWSRRPVILLVHHVHREQWPVIFGPLGARVGWLVESRLSPRLYRRSRYVTVSDVSRRELVELGVGSERISIVRNGTAAPLTSRLPRSATPRLVFLGRLVPHKRVELLLDAVAGLLPTYPDLTLDVVGSGWWEGQLREAVAARRLGGAVRLHGHVDEQTKHDLLAQAWVHAAPSLKEGWGLSVVEAASQGTPSVAFRNAGGLAESIVDGQTGLLAEEGVPAFQTALARLLDDATLRTRMGRAAVVHAGQFTWDNATTQLHGLITTARAEALSHARQGRVSPGRVRTGAATG